MKKLIIAVLCICLCLFGCGKTDVAETTEVTAELLYNADENTVEIGGEVLSAEEFTKSGSE